tara:strand:+ start:632 stop:1147 length:516 start_codon:yes stop_codon:yes gene_type:complete
MEQVSFYSKDIIKTSKKDDWETPQALFDKLNNIYKFTLDPCATHENAKCKKYYTKEDNGLSKDWGGEIVFMNPPYGRDIKIWVRKAYQESLNGATVVCLIPARTDTSYWHDYIFPNAKNIEFLRGRLKFEVNGAAKDPAPFPSAIIIFGDSCETCHNKVYKVCNCKPVVNK